MFEKRNSSGKHMICDIKGIKNTKSLNDMNDLICFLKNICEEHRFDILKESYHKFDPIGCSILFLLSESHISVHTFPERNHMSLDLYTCREYENNDVYEEIYNYIIKYLDASKESVVHVVDRYF